MRSCGADLSDADLAGERRHQRRRSEPTHLLHAVRGTSRVLAGSPHSSVDTGPPDHFPSASPMTSHPLVFGSAVNGERSESAGREAPLTAGSETKIIERRGGRGRATTRRAGRRRGLYPHVPRTQCTGCVGLLGKRIDASREPDPLEKVKVARVSPEREWDRRSGGGTTRCASVLQPSPAM